MARTLHISVAFSAALTLSVAAVPAHAQNAGALAGRSAGSASPSQATPVEPATVGSTGVVDPTAPGSAQDPTLQTPRPSVRAPAYVNSRGETGVDVNRDTSRHLAGTVPVDRPNPNSQAIDR